MFNNTNKRVTKLEKKSLEITSPFSKMLVDAQIHNSNILKAKQDIEDEIKEKLSQVSRLDADLAKNNKLISKLNTLFDDDPTNDTDYRELVTGL